MLSPSQVGHSLSCSRVQPSQLVSLSRVEGQTKYYMQLEEHQPTQDDHNEPSQDPIDEGYEGSSHQHFDLPLGSSGCTLLCAQPYLHGNPGRGDSSMPSSSIRDLIRVCFLSTVSLSTLCSFRKSLVPSIGDAKESRESRIDAAENDSGS